MTDASPAHETQLSTSPARQRMNVTGESATQFSVVIPTYNRAGELRQTLASLTRLQVAGSWEVIVVDNNSTDTTRKVVLAAASAFPAPLHYVFEAEPGRSAALNHGIKLARGRILATTDDDVRVEPDWLQRAADGLARHQSGFVGGRVLPLWEGAKPVWLSNRGGRHWAVIALLDYGSEPVEFGKRYAPLGVNLAFRREVFDQVGLWDNRIGRKAGTLLGQEVREWFLRARAAGIRGVYLPDMILHHVIPRDRLNKRYFRRWFYWHGISRAMLYQQHRVDMASPEETRLDYSQVPHILGVPRYMYRSLLRYTASMVKAELRRNPVEAFENELWLWFFAGVLRQRWKDRKQLPEPLTPASSTAATTPISGVHR